ncbi:hypothetical protein [uncultured Thiodictyon sp.]|uniref:hypothetical protein n=1 Tax=uncultured Thiodictyon sp. TaxID=1846217 RepID=UPI0025DFAC39|nr:hypothetical protein [uncultured Thiodictyon sp.]
MKQIVVAMLLMLVTLAGCQPAERTTSSSFWLKQQGAPADTAVIFMHGVLGGSKETWKSPSGIEGWPDIVLNDPQMIRADVLSVGYRSEPLREASNIEEIAVRTLRSIRDEGVFKN